MINSVFNTTKDYYTSIIKGVENPIIFTDGIKSRPFNLKLRNKFFIKGENNTIVLRYEFLPITRRDIFSYFINQHVVLETTSVDLEVMVHDKQYTTTMAIDNSNIVNVSGFLETDDYKKHICLPVIDMFYLISNENKGEIHASNSQETCRLLWNIVNKQT